MEFRKFVVILLFLIIFTFQQASGDPQIGNNTPGGYHQFVVTDVSPTEVYPSDIKPIAISIKNVDPENSAYAVTTMIDPNFLDSIQVMGELAKYGGDRIFSQEVFVVTYTFNVKDYAPKGIYYIPITIVWSVDKAKTILRQETVNIGIKVVDYPESIKIQTTGITTNPEHITPGDEFTINITAANVGNSKISEIRAVLGTDNPFSTIGSSAEQYVPVLEPGQNATTVFNLKVDKQAISRLYNFNYSLEYRDNLNRVQSQQTSFGINIEEFASVFIQDIRLDPTTLYPRTEGLLQIQVANSGTNSVKNVRIPIFGGDRILTQTQNYIGIINPGSTRAETSSFGVLVNPETPPGDYGLNIQLNYEDLTGQKLSKSNLYIIKINQQTSIIPISNQAITKFFYVIIFIFISYGIFLIVGSTIEKDQLSIKKEDQLPIKREDVKIQNEVEFKWK